jgi:hypothetical protein
MPASQRATQHAAARHHAAASHASQQGAAPAAIVLSVLAIYGRPGPAPDPENLALRLCLLLPPAVDTTPRRRHGDCFGTAHSCRAAIPALPPRRICEEVQSG